MREPHAIRRLRERYGVEITRGELQRIGHHLAIASYRDDPQRYRFVCDGKGETQVWQVNLEPYVGRTLWVTIVWNKPRRYVATALAVPPNLTAEQAKSHVDKIGDMKQQGFGARGPNQMPRDRKERKRA